MGLITKEEYLKLREENFAEISDEEEEKKELKRIDSQLSQIKNNNQSKSQITLYPKTEPATCNSAINIGASMNLIS